MNKVTVIIGMENLKELCNGKETTVKKGRITIRLDKDLERG